MAALSIPGTILSQFGMQIIPSNQCAATIVSTQSAISSRLASEYFIPKCPIAIPSSTPIVWNMKGTPPASRTALRTTSPNSCRWTCPGTMSVYELAIAINGLSKSASLWIAPVARNNARWGARSNPFFTMSERI